MSPPVMHGYQGNDAGFDRDDSVPNVVVVDPNFDAYKPLAAAARAGKLNLHFRSSGADAIKLARRLRVDAWLVASDLDDISGSDFVELLRSRLGESRLAIVPAAAPGTGEWKSAKTTAIEAGAHDVLPDPVTVPDLERLLGLPVEERTLVLAESTAAARVFVTLPVGVTAAAVAIAFLMLS